MNELDLYRILSHPFGTWEAIQIGQTQQVLVTEESFDSQYFVAHNRFYEQVLVPKESAFMGKMVEVNIYEAGKHFMKGSPLLHSKLYTPSISTPLAKGKVSGLTEDFKEQLSNGSNSPPKTSAGAENSVPKTSGQTGDKLKFLYFIIALFVAFFAFFMGKNILGYKSNILNM
ncbi:threonylcarbamoyladenosine tRNA methylthiotransferase isoform X1 [Pelobates cultripes]|uniref:Threonylcarbamoyladenosine tRNA methylthiotransferase isoform X1 n=1 Tax=Pelobates cultripes TaxID=61616 RepID=A0AAD1RZW2_PELCU|nr:threonylcarbamoyladenosine tRNA methylthiotransferase isoform X1 [Pelobates cultripes]